MDGTVAIAEIITGVNIALATMPVEECEPVDTNQNNLVGIDELIEAVDKSVNTCEP
jgi:hypothetical protein